MSKLSFKIELSKVRIGVKKFSSLFKVRFFSASAISIISRLKVLKILPNDICVLDIKITKEQNFTSTFGN